MHSYKAFGLNILSEIELPELSITEFSSYPDLHIRIENFELPKLSKTLIYRRGIRAGFAKDQNESLYLSWGGVANFMAVDQSLLLVSPLTVDSNLLSLFTVSEALGLILFQRGFFLLHASSVRVGNVAWCFMGSPGAGKSSTAAAFIKMGCGLLSDDLTAIRFIGDEAFVVPAYPQLKIWDKTVNGLKYEKSELLPVSEGVNKFSYQPKSDFSHELVRLKEIVFLHKARNRPAMEVLAAPEIPTETIKNFPLPVQLLTGKLLSEHFLQSLQCAKSAHIWRKRRPNGFDRLEQWVIESAPMETNANRNV